jgi:hypothetical protein
MNITESNIFATLMNDETMPTRDENGKFLPKAVREELVMELTRKLVKTMSRATEIDFRMYEGTRISKQANGTYLVEGAESNAKALRSIICEITDMDEETLKDHKFTTRQLGGQAWQLIKTASETRQAELDAKAEAVALLAEEQIAETEKATNLVEV